MFSCSSIASSQIPVESGTQIKNHYPFISVISSSFALAAVPDIGLYCVEGFNTLCQGTFCSKEEAVHSWSSPFFCYHWSHIFTLSFRGQKFIISLCSRYPYFCLFLEPYQRFHTLPLHLKISLRLQVFFRIKPYLQWSPLLYHRWYKRQVSGTFQVAEWFLLPVRPMPHIIY